MNLVLIRECSNSCPYCFEAAERQDGKQGQITLENAAQFAKWARSSRLPYLSLLGGEPFLHPKLKDIIQMLRQTAPGTALRILTGGVFNKDLLDDIKPADVSIVFNVNEPRDYRNPKHFNKVINNIELARRKGFKVSVGFNVWRRDFDTSFMPKLCQSLGFTHFTWTVANPIRGCESKVVSCEEFGPLAEECMTMLREAAALGLECTLDCPIPLCFFKESYLAWVRQYHPETASGMGVCEPVLDVTPELEVIRCFALSKCNRVKLVDFHDEGEIEEYFKRFLDTQLLDSGAFAECADCRHLRAGRCYGGCLAWHKGEVDTSAKPQAAALESRMYRLVTDGNPKGAIELYETANYWAKNSLAVFAAAVAALQLGELQKAYSYAVEANSKASNPEFMQQITAFIAGIPEQSAKMIPGAGTGDTAADFMSCDNLKTTEPAATDEAT